MRVFLDNVVIDPFFQLKNLVFKIAKHCKPDIRPDQEYYLVELTKFDDIYTVSHSGVKVATIEVIAGEAIITFSHNQQGVAFKACFDVAIKEIDMKVNEIIAV